MGAELNHQIGDRFQPIAGQCIGLVYGNHEDSYQLRTDAQNMHQDLCKALGVQNLGYSCFQRIEFQRGNRAHGYTIRAHHGSGWAQSDGGVINRLTKFMAQTDADLTLVGHLHKMDTAKKIELRFNGTAMVQRVKLGVLTGTYLRTYQDGITTYAEKRGYDPVPLGSYRIPLQPFGERTIGDVVV